MYTNTFLYKLGCQTKNYIKNLHLFITNKCKYSATLETNPLDSVNFLTLSFSQSLILPYSYKNSKHPFRSPVNTAYQLNIKSLFVLATVFHQQKAVWTSLMTNTVTTNRTIQYSGITCKGDNYWGSKYGC